jgi:xanthine dehydrogenase YagS FAD-binding subunit
MESFTYTKPATVREALAAGAAAAGTSYIAGGTDILDLMKLGVAAPTQLIDITGLPLSSITMTGHGASIGALARLSDVASHKALQRLLPLISQALLASASGQVRNMATIGGNLMQRTRCPYFRGGGGACNKRSPGSGCESKTGFNRGAAILGASADCIASHPSDLAVALAALDAELVLSSATAERRLAIADFYLLPGHTPQLETALQPGELISSVFVPSLPAGARALYSKVRDRASFEFALVSVAAVITLQRAKIHSARIALGGVAPRPWRVAGAETALVGKPATPANFRAAADALLHGAAVASLNAFKLPLARNAIVRTLDTLTRAPA